MDLQKVGKFIAKMRKKVGMTQSDLGEALGVSGKAVSKWERGLNAPDIAVLVELSKLLNVTATEILVGEKINNNMTTEAANEIAISSISTYNNYSKKKYMRIIGILILLIISIITIFSTTYFITNYNKCFVYKLSSADNNFYLEGLIASNQKENSIIITGIRVDSNSIKADENTNNYKVELKLDSMELYREGFVYDKNKEKSLSQVLYHINIIINKSQIIPWDKKKIIDKDKTKMKIVITFYNNKLELQKIIIPIKFEKKFSNDKLFY